MNFLLLIYFCLCFNQEIPNFNEKNAMQYLNEQCDFGPRFPGSNGHGKMKLFLNDFLKPISDTLYVMDEEISHPYYGRIMNLTNYLARFNLNSSYRIMIMAHWDTREFADKDLSFNNQKLPVLGANDGASGVAVLLTLAEIISTYPLFNIGIDLLFVDGEDQGISGKPDTFGLGTQAFAKKIPAPKPKFAICVDMVADFDQTFYIEKFSLNQAPHIVEEIWTLANDLGYLQFEKKIGPAIMDDHYYLYKHAKIPAIDIIDFDYPNKEINYWHTIQDVPENCSSQSLSAIGTVMTQYIYQKDIEYEIKK